MLLAYYEHDIVLHSGKKRKKTNTVSCSQIHFHISAKEQRARRYESLKYHKKNTLISALVLRFKKRKKEKSIITVAGLHCQYKAAQLYTDTFKDNFLVKV